MSEPCFETLDISVERGVCLITLSRPEKLNAMNHQMIKDLRQVQLWVEEAPEVKAILLSGAGRSFCVGFDLQEADAATDIPGVKENRKILEEDFAMLMGFWNCSKPTISAVFGHCLAGGMELGLSCDLTIAGENTRFGEPELRFGVGIGCMLMPWLTGPKQAKEIYFLGDDRISAADALSMGLINRVVPDGQVLDSAMAMAQKLAVIDEDAMRMTKMAMNRSYEIMGMRDAMQVALDIDVEIASLDTPDRRKFREISVQEGLKAALAWRNSRFDQ
ncbi:enoyl-CoA hydratase/isomerase family protein [Rhodobacteraceae bacterium B1Z28]|uniref:Enoyl-CoA hydratase/isomerase family protein n=1 Tax=Ruegeria haliotis TaxID=2747601 RepID=A0ABX2PS34_9RHOB|nr:enoyl-CoA hydratase/isomerase family protein [Ruegeria haliotis]NVO56978.1 enoyl-CoA hydratase/isomerase family protein [Ruegeria haliotis]